jgi:hypothetical protein
MEEPVKCETKSRAIRSNKTGISNVDTQGRLLLGCLAGLMLVHRADFCWGVLQVLCWYTGQIAAGASCRSYVGARKSVVQGRRVNPRVDLGGGRSREKKKV